MTAPATAGLNIEGETKWLYNAVILAVTGIDI